MGFFVRRCLSLLNNPDMKNIRDCSHVKKEEFCRNVMFLLMSMVLHVLHLLLMAFMVFLGKDRVLEILFCPTPSHNMIPYTLYTLFKTTASAIGWNTILSTLGFLVSFHVQLSVHHVFLFVDISFLFSASESFGFLLETALWSSCSQNTWNSGLRPRVNIQSVEQDTPGLQETPVSHLL